MISVSPASTNSSAKGLPNSAITTRESREYTTPTRMQDRSPWPMRSSFFAPMFCPPQVDMVTPMASKAQLKNM